MNKTEVYSWRLTAQLKAELEQAARDLGISISDLIETAVRERLDGRAKLDEREQARTQAIIDTVAGSVAGPGISATNKNVREAFAVKAFQDRIRRRGPRTS